MVKIKTDCTLCLLKVFVLVSITCEKIKLYYSRAIVAKPFCYSEITDFLEIITVTYTTSELASRVLSLGYELLCTYR